MRLVTLPGIVLALLLLILRAVLLLSLLIRLLISIILQLVALILRLVPLAVLILLLLLLLLQGIFNDLAVLFDIGKFSVQFQRLVIGIKGLLQLTVAGEHVAAVVPVVGVLCLRQLLRAVL